MGIPISICAESAAPLLLGNRIRTKILCTGCTVIHVFRSMVTQWLSVRLGIAGPLVPDSLEALCPALEQDTLSSA